MSKLSPKQVRFVAEYLVDLNATQAAIRAGYSARSAKEQACVLLTKPNIANAVQAGQAKRLSKLDITAERVLAEFARIGFSDLRTVFDQDGHLRAPADLTDATAATIASVEIVRETTRKHGETAVTEQVTKVKAWDKVRALEALAKNLGLLKDRTVFENPDGTALAVQIYLPSNHRDAGA